MKGHSNIYNIYEYSEKFLLNEYIKMGKSCDQISRETNLPRTNIYMRLKEFKIHTRNKSQAQIGKSGHAKGAHPKGRKMPKGKNSPLWKRIKKICKCCGIVFYAYPCEIKKGGGIHCSKKCKDIFQRGKNHCHWKGGIPQNRKITMEYRKWRKAVFERDNYRCLICGEVGGCLNAHHIKSWKGFPKLRYDVNNGMTMCQECHHLAPKETPLFVIKKRTLL